jgi:oxygen-independent coproporphyrinogen-3 oxidase
VAFGIYVHIPFCLQRCHYCDFATFELGKTAAVIDYLKALANEIQARKDYLPSTRLDTIYFGGGTPSLLEVKEMEFIFQQFAKAGLSWNANCEITIEINPATMNEDKLKAYCELGINRFSVGAQTFNEDLLKTCGRKHNADDTRSTLELLRKHQLNFSFDLLFALPGQSLEHLQKDLDEVAKYDPPHISLYYLTVPDGHRMSTHRPVESQQVKMFERLHEQLTNRNYLRYEISNFARPGFESRHNLLYWTDQAYWGFGLSAHSYLNEPEFGMRFWNPKHMSDYLEQNRSAQSVSLPEGPLPFLPKNQFEKLKKHEALTDFCHTSLRSHLGLNKSALRRKFGEEILAHVETTLKPPLQKQWVTAKGLSWVLTEDGQLFSNQVFQQMTFLESDLRALSQAGLCN